MKPNGELDLDVPAEKALAELRETNGAICNRLMQLGIPLAHLGNIRREMLIDRVVGTFSKGRISFETEFEQRVAEQLTEIDEQVQQQIARQQLLEGVAIQTPDVSLLQRP